MAVSTSIECVLPRPDIAELSQAVRTELSKRLLGGAPVVPLSSEDILAFVMAGTTNLMHGFVTQALREQDPEYMCCDNLVLYAARRNMYLLGAARSKGYIAISGDPEAIIPGTLRFIGPSSREYKIDPAVSFNPLMLDANGGAVVRIVSTLAGAIYNLPTGTELTVGATVSGIDGTGTIVGSGMMGGLDAETCEELRRRVLAAESESVIALNEAWYLEHTLRYPGVTRACTDACQGCCDSSTMTIYPFMEGIYGDVTEAPYGVPPCTVIDQMSDWMFGRESGRGQGLAPVGIRGRFQAALPVEIDVVARCLHGCPVDVDDRIREALWAYIRYNVCVGSTLCKDQMTAAVYRLLGSDNCIAGLEYTVPMRYEDSANIYLDCGTFPVLGTVEVKAVYNGGRRLAHVGA